MSTADPYAATETETTQGKVYTVTGQDWDSVVTGIAEDHDDKVVVNMGPQHPSTHGVLRLILELEGETVTEARCGVGYLHTGIEKNMEFRSWTQGVTFCTRMDYLSPFYNEATYVLGVERLLDIEEDVPEKAQVMRVLLMELNRISSHLVAIATGGMEIGALTVMTIGFRERELVLDLFELITGLRMNHAFIRPGGVAQDMPAGALDEIRDFVALMKKRLPEYADLCNANPIFKARLVDVGHLDLAGCLALGLTGPVLRSTGYPWDLRKTQPYSGYEDYDFDVCTWDTADSYGRFRIRLNEMWESLRIVEQCVERLAGLEGAPVMVADKKIAWPSQLAIGSDGMGNSLDHIKHIMGESMEALIHHFKLVTEGFRVPAGQAYVPVESPRGELGAHVVSDGGTRPYRAHFRDPSFTNLQATSVMSEGGMVADVIVAIASHRPRDGRRRPVSRSTEAPAGRSDAASSRRSRRATRTSAPACCRCCTWCRASPARSPPRASRLVRRSWRSRAAEVSGVATFYTMYKRRPVGDYHVGVCTNTLCAIMGGDLIFERLKDHLDVGNDETTEDGQGHPRARRVQRRLRLRPGDDGQLGVHGQPDPRVRGAGGRRPARRQGGPLDPRAEDRHLARGRAGARRLPRRPRRRGSGRRSGLAGRVWRSPARTTDGPHPGRAVERGRGRVDELTRHPDPGPHRQLGRRPRLDARLLRVARRLRRAAQGADDAARTTSSPRSRTPGSAAAAARASRPG